MNEPKTKPRKVSITYDEYMAIRYGMNEIDNLIMSGQDNREEVEIAKKHYDNLEKLICKINRQKLK